MNVEPIIGRGSLIIVALLVAGCCSIGKQTSQVAFERSGKTCYVATEVKPSADKISTFAVLSANVYDGTFALSDPRYSSLQPPPLVCEQLSDNERGQETAVTSRDKCLFDPKPALAHFMDGWVKWENFPSSCLMCESGKLGLYVQVWEKRSPSDHVIAVVFKGTRFTSLADWTSNLRWMVPHLFRRDQYTTVGKPLIREFVVRYKEQVLPKLEPGGPPVRLVTAGHSLGGGLAQYFAYALPPKPESPELPRISEVYAFDSSPITGRSTIDDKQWQDNAENLKIYQVFEHGEALAYLRLLLGRLNPRGARDPEVRTIRYDFDGSKNPIKSHSMLRLACEIASATGKLAEPHPGEMVYTLCNAPARSKAGKVPRSKRDSWYATPPNFPSEHYTALSGDRFAPVPEEVFLRYYSELKVKEFIEIEDEEVLASILPSGFQAPAGLKPYIVRALVPGEEDCKLSVSVIQPSLRVAYVCPQASDAPLHRSAVLVFLKDRPCRAFVDVAVNEAWDNENEED